MVKKAKEVFIKYNPYKLETEVTIDGRALAENSELIKKGSRLQEWIESLPRKLVDESNTNEFVIKFHGTQLDFEDLTEVMTKAHNDGILNATLEHIPAKETAEKEAEIDKIFEEIANCPIPKLKEDLFGDNSELLNAYRLAKGAEFEICVVATMSSGKSTLINAMLGTKLMPSKQEACTAMITRIKDTDELPFKAAVYDKNDKLLRTSEDLTLKEMEDWNADEKVSEIKVFGNIPFVTNEDTSLVLIDTPGPNNARNTHHRAVQQNLLNKSSKALVLYIMTGTYGADDDNALLGRVAESMKVGGKQSKDRFMFVLNKLDERSEEDGDLNDTLNSLRMYLKNHGIENPNIFPAGALPAMNIRLQAQGDLPKVEQMRTNMQILTLNCADYLHLEKYATLTPRLQREIEGRLQTVQQNWQDDQDLNPETALIHTGIPSIEAAIRQYVQKYAKTAKIKNVVDSFMGKIEQLDYLEQLMKDISENKDLQHEYRKQINYIQSELSNKDEAKKFRDAVDLSMNKVNKKALQKIDDLIQTFQKRIRERIDALKGEKLEIREAEYEVERLSKFAKKLLPDFADDLSELIEENLINTSNTLLEQYKNKLANLMQGINFGDFVIDPLKMVQGNLSFEDFSMRQFVKEEKVADGEEKVAVGEEWVKNYDKAWYKPWTWFQEKGHWRTKYEVRTIYKTVKYVSGSELAQGYLEPVKNMLFEGGADACEHAKHEAAKIAQQFNNYIAEIDNKINQKLTDMKGYIDDENKAKQRVTEAENNLKWLQNIQNKVQAVLEI